MIDEDLNFIICPHCEEKIFIEGKTNVIDLPSDSERCTSRTEMFKLRCTKNKGHTDISHEHYPYTWMNRPIWVDETK